MMEVMKECVVCVLFLLFQLELGNASTNGGQTRTICMSEDILELEQRISSLETGLVERVALLETRESVYKEEREQLFHYFNVLTKMLQRLMDLEKDNDLLKKSVQELEKEQINTIATLQEIKNKGFENETHMWQEIQSDREETMRTLQEIQKEQQDASRSVQEFKRNISVELEFRKVKLQNFSLDIKQMKEHIRNETNKHVRERSRQEVFNAEVSESIKSFKENLKNETARSKAEIQSTTTELLKIEESCNSVDNRVQTTLQQMSEHLNTNILTMNRHINNSFLKMQAELAQLTPTQGRSQTTIAYSGKVDGDPFIQQDDILFFSNININTHDSYNVSDGKFYCPVDGVYLVHLTLIVRDIPYCNVAINQNSDMVLQVYAGLSERSWPTGSGAIAVTAASGDTIWVRGFEQKRCQISDVSRLTIVSV